MHSPNLKMGTYTPSLRVEALPKLFGTLQRRRLLFSPQLFMSVRTHGFYTSSFNLILLYFVIQMVPVLAFGSSFSWPDASLACVCVCVCVCV
jgi:hypothetical protein